MGTTPTQRAEGFTLVEVLLSIILISILTGISLPVYNSFIARNDLSLVTQNVASMLRRAEVYARGNKGDSEWGVNFAPGVVTLFEGSNYVARDSAFDEALSVPSSITISYSGDIILSKLTGSPSTTPTITLTSNITNDNKTVVINAKGMVAD